MGRLLKIILYLVAGLVGIVVVAAISLALFFDPNDFRDRISAAVKESTGRDLVISGDINLTLFPWLAVEIGQTELGNAEGFGDEHFLSFDEASLSVRIMPLILRQEIEVGTAALGGLDVNLEVRSDGRSNWDDLAEGGGEDDTATAGGEGAGPAGFDVANIVVSDANVSYLLVDTQYAISNFAFETGRIAANTPIDMSGEFDFSSDPGELGGHIAMRATMTMTEDAGQVSLAGLNVNGTLDGVISGPAEFNFDARELFVDTEAQTISPGEMDLTVLGIGMAANVEPFLYTGTPQPVAELRVATFSLKELMQLLDIEPPETADPEALTRVSFSARAAVSEESISMTAMTLEMDESTMTGEMSLPMTESGALRFDLTVDSIVVDAYMAPASEAPAASDEQASADVEIPADLIRTLNVAGSFRIDRAWLTGMEFTNMELGVTANDGRLRLNPLSADFYDGGYSGDVQIDASQAVPFVSTNERIASVNLGEMMKALFDVEDITGTINGHFALQGAGPTVNAIQRDLDGTISVALLDGAWEGTDIWHQLRTARATFRQEPAPEPTLPARTEFTEISATGVVTDGVFSNDDFRAELPFLQLTGGGTIDIISTEVDYSMEVRVLERPEFMSNATEEELEDFTETVVPLKISGLMAAPSIRPDMEGIFRARVEEALEEKKDELRNELLERLLGPEDPPPDGEPQAEGEEEEDPEEKLKRDLLKRIFER
jgi:AsmA protein